MSEQPDEPAVSPGGASATASRGMLHAPHRALIALALFVVAEPVRAAELEVRGPEACSDREELAFRVSRSLGGLLEQVPNLGFSVDVSESGKGYQALLNVTDDEHPGPPSVRRIDESSCPQLMDALSIVIVLAIHRVQGRVDAKPAAPESAASVPRAVEDEGGEEPAPSSAAAFEPVVSAWLVGDVGALPDPGLGLSVSLEVTTQRFRMQAAGVLFFEQHAGLEGNLTPAPGADLGLALGVLSACYAPVGSWNNALVFGACARAEAGSLYGSGTNVRGASSRAQVWLAPGLDLLGSWSALPWLRLGLQLGATVPILRPQFALGELGDLYRPAALTFRTALGVGVVIE